MPFTSLHVSVHVCGQFGESVEEHGAVEGVALDGFEAGVADDAAEFFFSGAVGCSGCFDDVLFEHDGAYVVAAEVEAELENLEALRDPGGLHVFDVVEVEARNGEDLQVLDGCGFFPSSASECCVLGLEAPGDEGGESAGFFLEAAHNFEVIDALIEGFANAEHHGRGGAHAELVCGAMDADPVFGAAFEAGDALADVVVEDFCATARDGVESGVAKTGDGGAQVEVGVLGDGEDFRCREAVEPDFGEALLDSGEETFEPVDFQIGMKAALHEDARAAHFLCFGNFLVDFFEVEDVALFGARDVFSFLGERPVERAESAVFGAEVGVVDVAIDDVGDHAFRMEAATDGVGLEAQPNEIGGIEVIEGLRASERHGFSLQRTEAGLLAAGN